MENISKKERAEKIRKSVFKFLSLKLIIICFLFVGALFTFAIIVHEAVFGNEQAFDNTIFSHLTVSSAWLISVMKIFTFFGSQNFLIPAYLVVLLFLIKKRKYRNALHVAILAVSSTALIFAIKSITHRQRPDLPIIAGISNYSFPSGHALSTFIFCGIFVYIIWHGQLHLFYKWLYSLLFLCFAVMVGISRIALRVHFPTDVIASFCLGTIWSILSLWILRAISKEKKHTKPESQQALNNHHQKG